VVTFKAIVQGLSLTPSYHYKDKFETEINGVGHVVHVPTEEIELTLQMKDITYRTQNFSEGKDIDMI